MKRIISFVVAAVAAVLLVGCGGSSPPGPDSDSAQGYNGGKIPVDLNVYNVTGVVSGQVGSLTRQRTPASGSIDGFMYGSYGSLGGSFYGPVETGKGFVRLKVNSISPATDTAKAGNFIIIKSSDTKGTALLAGDTVTFRCRRQYEAVAAVKNDQHFDAKTDGTWEFDYCRLASPQITPAPVQSK